MSPILKRDIADQIRQTKRFAAAAIGSSYLEDESYRTPPFEEQPENQLLKLENIKDGDRGGPAFTSSSSARQGMGVHRNEIEQDHNYKEAKWLNTKAAAADGKDKGKAISEDFGNLPQDEMNLLVSERPSVDSWKDNGPLNHGFPGESFGYAEPELEIMSSNTRKDKWKDMMSLLFEATPSVLLSLVGLVFTGQLLEHLARWRVFRRVDELFILVPMIGNLKGNLEMCLSARLGTSANIGELDHRVTRRTMLMANMTLLGLQSLIISSVAAFISFVLGLLTIHRLGDIPEGVSYGNSTNPGLESADQEWHEGYTRPGWKQLVMVLATGMGSAGISSAVLGSFMGSLVVVSRWAGADPDNITPPLAACLGDLLTLFILSLLGTALVGAMDTVIPLLAVVIMSSAAGWFTRRVVRNVWVKEVAKGGWVPLIGAMLISSGTGMVLSIGVGKYRGFALLAISMTGLTGSIGAIHANRLSTQLHTLLHPTHPRPRSVANLSSLHGGHSGLTPFQRGITLFLIAYPCQGAFLFFVTWVGWVDTSLGWTVWVAFSAITLMSLVIAHYLTLFFWSKDLDPDSYTLPIHSALVDFMGQVLLMLAYETCISLGRDVVVKNP
ncbi:solute carrier family 41 [Cryptococcus deuterogattii 2001/935-1]|nr:solute carrier family 41 [Cryptococcus deuterogattii 2001/935-1]